MDDKNLQTNKTDGSTPRWDQVQLPDSAGQLPAIPEPIVSQPQATEPSTPVPASAADPQRSIFRTKLSSNRFTKRSQSGVEPAAVTRPSIETLSDIQPVPTEAAAAPETETEAAEIEALFADEPAVPTPEVVPASVGPIAAPATVEAPTTIAINISLPELTKLKPAATAAFSITLKLIRGVLRLFRAVGGRIIVLATKPLSAIRGLSWKVATAGLAGCLIVAGLSLGGLRLWQHKPVVQGSNNTASVGKAVSGAATPAVSQPTFTPVAPKDKPQLATLHTGVSSFDAKHDVYSYSDTVRNNAILVSEQPIPASFSSKEQALSTVSKSLNATQAITVGSDKAMIATNSKSNSQTVVYVYQDLLIFIQSPFTHTSPDWQAYLSSLKEQ